MGVANIQTFNVVPGNRIKFTYKNWKGRVAERHCIVESFSIGRSEYHGETIQGFLNGLDLDKNMRRSYAIVDIDIDTLEHY